MANINKSLHQVKKLIKEEDKNRRNLQLSGDYEKEESENKLLDAADRAKKEGIQ